MQENKSAKVDNLMPGQAGPAIDYALAVDELLQLYTRIDLASVALPMVGFGSSILPFVKREPQRSTNDGHWNGDGFAFISIRPLVTRMLHGHFHRRLRALRQHVMLATAFSEDAAKVALARIDRAMDFWKPHITVGSILFGWLPILVGMVGSVAAVGTLFPRVDLGALFAHSWVVTAFGATIFWGLFLALYLFIFLGSAFAVKRGLMLGGKGRGAYYPNSLPGSGSYAQERKVLGGLGLAISEFPLDLVFAIPGSLFLVFGFKGIGDYIGPTAGLIFALLWVALSAVYYLIGWRRRKKLGRC
jgi:hypothetical protein